MTTFEQKALNTLKSVMSPEDFAKLNWSNIKIAKLNNEPSLLRIQSKSDTSKFLYYGVLDNKEYYNWVQLSLSGHSMSTVGTIVINSVTNELLHNYVVKDNKVIYDDINTSISNNNSTFSTSNAVIFGTAPVDPTLPDVTVQAWIGDPSEDDSYNLSSLYWAFGGNYSYFPYYSSPGLPDIINLIQQGLSPVNLIAVIRPLSDGTKLITIIDNKTFWYANASITFKLDANNQLIDGSASITISGISPTYTPAPIDAATPIPTYMNNTANFQINGQFSIPLTAIAGLPISWNVRTIINCNYISGASQVQWLNR